MKSKKELKKQKGITLIALVITIIVLLILAGISISMLTGQNGILNRAQEAKEKTELAGEDELRKLTQMQAAMNLENTTHTDNSTGKEKTVTIPGGFAVSQVEGENTINDGLVIIDQNGNEFVWVPVENVISHTEEEANSNKAMAINIGTEEEPQYRGILYNFENLTSTVREGCTTSSDDYREPDFLNNSNVGDNSIYNIDSNGNKIVTSENLQNEFNNMIESVITYGGFYIGRYETSINNEEVESKKNVLPTSSSLLDKHWYDFYLKQKNFSSQFIQGSMIWGSQYDAMLNWVLTGKDKEKMETKIYGNHSGEIQKTGMYNNGTDKINNIFDLEGNLREWTLEANDSDNRSYRGGNFLAANTPVSRSHAKPNNADEIYGSRIIIYIK